MDDDDNDVDPLSYSSLSFTTQNSSICHTSDNTKTGGWSGSLSSLSQEPLPHTVKLGSVVSIMKFVSCCLSLGPMLGGTEALSLIGICVL